MKPNYRWLAVVACLLVPVQGGGAAPARAQMPDRAMPHGQWDMWDPPWMRRHMWGPGPMGPGMRPRVARHWAFMHQGIPAAYRGARNPLPSDARTVGEGQALYREKCASCHGPTGMGDGKDAHALNPSPALLAYLIQRPIAVDEYMLWSVSDGGEPFGTAMPAFKDVLSRAEIWKIVTYMRAGFPDRPAK